MDLSRWGTSGGHFVGRLPVGPSMLLPHRRRLPGRGQIRSEVRTLHTTTDKIDVHDLRTKLLPRLQRRVFHVTTHSAYGEIVRDGAIKAGGELPTRYPNAYFRWRGYVSLCDLRFVTDDQVNLALDRWYFLNPEGDRASPAFLFLYERAFSRLVSWKKQMENRDLDKLVVPYIEAGYPGDISLELIREALLVTINHPPPSEWLRALRSRAP